MGWILILIGLLEIYDLHQKYIKLWSKALNSLLSMLSIQWNLSWETTAMRDHLSWRTTSFSQKVLHFQCNWPVTKDQLSWETTFLWPMGWSFKICYTVLWIGSSVWTVAIILNILQWSLRCKTPRFYNSLHFKTSHQWHHSYIFNTNILYFKTTSNLRPKFYGWRGGVKMQGPLYSYFKLHVSELILQLMVCKSEWNFDQNSLCTIKDIQMVFIYID